MSFLHPEYFYYFLPPLVIVFGFLLSKKEAQSYFFSDEVMKKLMFGSNTLTLKKRNILFLFIFLFIIIALAGPIIKDGEIEIKSKSADIMIALDISDSMLAEDVYPNRLKFAKEKAMELLRTAPDERIGVIAFAKNSYLVSPMSFDHDAVGFLLRQLNTDSITEKGTNFLSLLKVVDKTIKKESKKYLLILSDGGDKEDFTKEIESAKEKNIIVFILGLGTTKGAPIKQKDGSFIKYKGDVIVSKLNENISKFATSSGGVYIQSIKSNEDVKAILKEIDNISDKKELKSEKVKKFRPLFYYPVAIALLLLIIAISSFSKRSNTSLVLVFFALLFVNLQIKADILDFVDLKDAKKAYNNGDFETSQKIYSGFAEKNNNSQSHYNNANSLYKQKKYDEAIKAYGKTNFDNDIQKANNLANIGNSYVKQAKEDSLKKAEQSYEKSLELNEDKDVRENLEAVKKEIKKQKEKKKEEDKNKEKDKNKDNKKDDKNKDKKDSKDSKDSKDADESKEDSKDKDSKSEDSKDKDSKKESEKESEKEKDSKKQQQDSKEKKDELEKLENNDKKNNESKSSAVDSKNKNEMSEEEEKKWLKQLNSQQNTFMYMLNDSKLNEDNLDEKPW